MNLDAAGIAPAPYDASAIRVLTDAEVITSFEWAEVGSLAAQYGAPSAFVRRGLEACRRAGVPPTYLIDRYLRLARPDPAVPLDLAVDVAMRDVLVEERP